jgi:hypothetical protein
VQLGNEEDMAAFVAPNTSFVARVDAMEARVQRLGLNGGGGGGGQLRYVLSSDVGSDGGAAVIQPSEKGGLGNTALLVEQLATRPGWCGRVLFDWHIIPAQTECADDGPAGGGGCRGLGLANLDALQALLAEKGGAVCAGLKVAVETNLGNNRFERALANAATTAAAQRRAPFVAAHAVSQCWTAAAHFDGAGESHTETAPNGTWGMPAYYGAQLVYGSYRGTALPTAVRNGSSSSSSSSTSSSNGTWPEGGPLSIWAVTDGCAGGGDGNGGGGGDFCDVVLRVTNAANATAQMLVTLLHRWSAASATLEVQRLTTPLARASADEYAAQKGGENTAAEPTFITPAHTPSMAVLDASAAQLLAAPPRSISTFRWLISGAQQRSTANRNVSVHDPLTTE